MQALVVGLIALIPIAGFMNLYGWSLATAANLRAGYRVAAPANFDYIGRGALFVAWTCLVWVIQMALVLAVGAVAAVASYTATRDWAWTAALGVASAVTVLSAISLALTPLTVPVLTLTAREGLGAALDPRRVVLIVRQNWDAAWYGATALLAWVLVYQAASYVTNAVPFLGIFLGLALAVPAYGVIGLMLAAPLARFGDPPGSFNRTHTSLVAALYTVWFVALVLGVWVLGLIAAALVSSHPDETRCTFEPGCHYTYAGDRETLARITRDDRDPALVRVSVTFVNHGGTPAAIDPAGFAASLEGQHENPIRPSDDCPAPAAQTVGPRSQASETACFRLADLTRYYDVEVPWTGWENAVLTPEPESSGQ